MKKYILLGITLLILGVINFQIFMKEKTINSGRTMLLQLVPVDPRSLMQGDYMILRYAMANKVGKLENNGCLVVTLDVNDVATFSRVYKGEELKVGELLLMYRNRGNLRLGAESFFFQEGHAEIYSNAKYGKLKVDESGNSVLIGLCDSKFTQLSNN